MLQVNSSLLRRGTLGDNRWCMKWVQALNEWAIKLIACSLSAYTHLVDRSLIECLHSFCMSVVTSQRASAEERGWIQQVHTLRISPDSFFPSSLCHWLRNISPIYLKLLNQNISKSSPGMRSSDRSKRCLSLTTFFPAVTTFFGHLFGFAIFLCFTMEYIIPISHTLNFSNLNINIYSSQKSFPLPLVLLHSIKKCNFAPQFHIRPLDFFEPILVFSGGLRNWYSTVHNIIISTTGNSSFCFFS